MRKIKRLIKLIVTESALSHSLIVMSAAHDPKNDSRKCIIHAASALFAKLGLDKCSTREIAKASKSNISLISYYFGGKEGLYKEVMRSHALEIKESAQNVMDLTEKSKMTKEAFVFHMSQMIDNMIRMRIENPEMAQIFAREKLAGMPYAKEVHNEIFYPLANRFFEIFKKGQDSNIVRRDVNPAFFFIALSESLWGFFEVYSCQTSLNKDFENLFSNPIELRDQIIKIYLTGVLV